MAAKGIGWVGPTGPEPWTQNSFVDWTLDRYRLHDFRRWFDMLGVTYQVVRDPADKTPIVDPIKNDSDVSVYFATGHGTPNWAMLNRSGQYIYPSDIQSALDSRGPMKFSFVIHSNAMDDFLSENTWAYRLRKGWTTGTAVVGTQKGPMGLYDWWGWWWSWAEFFMVYVSYGLTFKEAFELANKKYPRLEPHMIFVGDGTIGKKDLA